ncbi:MAG: hypothetical protein ACE5F1_21755, partial [Planctomycetota bacterium]
MSKAPCFMTLGCMALTLQGGSAIAQTNTFEIYPDAAGSATSFTSRGSFGTQKGETLQELSSIGYAGVGDNALGGGTCSIKGFQAMSQDQNCATQEKFTIIFRKCLADGKTPDATPSGIIFVSGTLLTPRSTGICAFRLSATFATPIKVPCKGCFHFGKQQEAAPLWTSDGHSTHAASYLTTRSRGDNPRGMNSARNFAWNVIGSATTASNTASGRVWRMSVLVESAVLNQGASTPGNTRHSPTGSPGYGAQGILPDVADANSSSPARFDDLAIRIRDRANAGGAYALFFSSGRSSTPIQ